MTQKIRQRLVLLISLLMLLGGCTSQKSRIFGKDMPTMKSIHDEKFHTMRARPELAAARAITDNAPRYTAFEWLPNPTLHLYVFEHLSPTGLPVPGYMTFFKFYTTDHIALPHEKARW